MLTGLQVQKREMRARQLKAMPAHKRPTYKSQMAAPGKVERPPSIIVTKKSRVRRQAYSQLHPRLHPETKRSRAEILAQARTVHGPYFTRPSSPPKYRMEIPKGLWSDPDLVRMGFQPVRKPKRAFSFTGPTAKADAEAFDDKMMKWLKKWNPNVVGSPPQP